MKILKFGGTSVGSAKRMQNVKRIINTKEGKIVVLSAMSGTTNSLIEIFSAINANNIEQAKSLVNQLKEKYNKVLEELFSNIKIKTEANNYVNTIFKNLESFISITTTKNTYSKIVSKGELLSTYLFTCYLKQEGVKAKLLPALDFMRIDKQKEPDMFYIKKNLERILKENASCNLYITQGFICLDAQGEIADLERGGSDYTATILGATLKASEVQIWTDIDGMHNNDPRFVKNTHSISNLSFDEAAELAYFGAKILHPQTVMPAREANIPVRLKNTKKPETNGTLITSKVSSSGIKAIAAKDNITAITIKSARMLLAYGFLKKVFEIFEKYQTAIDMITTSEIAVSLTIDNTTNLPAIIQELKTFSTVKIDTEKSIICLVGNEVVNHSKTYKMFKVLKDIPIRMISYGGSKNNISLLVSTSKKAETLQKLHGYLFS